MIAEFRVEALAASHDRASFHCGVPELDKYFQPQVGQDVRRRVATAFVMVDPAGSIVGYCTLSAYGVHLPDLPEGVVKRLPRYPILPATLLGRLAISQGHQGKNLGRFLLMDALYRSLRSTSRVASIGIVVDALNDSAQAFYRHYGFTQLPDHPGRLFRAMSDIDQAFKTH